MAPSASSIIERDQIAWRERFELRCAHDLFDVRLENGVLRCSQCDRPLQLRVREVSDA